MLFLGDCKNISRVRMKNEEQALIEQVRHYLSKHHLQDISVEHIEKSGIDMKFIIQKFGSISALVDELLKQERFSFEHIFTEYNFEEQNAIDILLIVSQEISNRFYHINPGITANLRKLFPDTYQKHIEDRLNFIFSKIKINIEKGMTQKVYKTDISSEMVARMYVSKLNDIINPTIYPTENFSFATIFNELITDFVQNIANRQGLQYYKQRKQLYGVLNFGRH